jgi:hypothetical protein
MITLIVVSTHAVSAAARVHVDTPVRTSRMAATVAAAICAMPSVNRSVSQRFRPMSPCATFAYANLAGEKNVTDNSRRSPERVVPVLRRLPVPGRPENRLPHTRAVSCETSFSPVRARRSSTIAHDEPARARPGEGTTNDARRSAEALGGSPRDRTHTTRPAAADAGCGGESDRRTPETSNRRDSWRAQACGSTPLGRALRQCAPEESACRWPSDH